MTATHPQTLKLNGRLYTVTADDASGNFFTLRGPRHGVVYATRVIAQPEILLVCKADRCGRAENMAAILDRGGVWEQVEVEPA